MKYLVVEEVKSQTKVRKGIFVFDLFFIVVWMTMTGMLGSIVHSNFKIIYYVFSFCCGLFLTLTSGQNRKRRNYQSMVLFLKKDREVYYPENKADDTEVEDEEEEYI